MKLIQLKCPNCGAGMPLASPNAEWASCGYCQGTFYIQRPHSRVAPPPGQAVVVAPAPNVVPLFVALAAMLVLMVLAGVAYAVFKQHSVSSAETQTKYVANRGPLIGDANGDGVEDAIFWLGDLPIEGAELAAYDGVDGRELWRTAEFGPKAASEARSVFFGGVLIVDKGLKLSGVAVRTGKVAWSKPLDSRTMTYCVTGGKLQLTLENRQTYGVEPSTGALTPAKETFQCEPHAHDQTFGSADALKAGHIATIHSSSDRISPLADDNLTTMYEVPAANGFRVVAGQSKRGRLPFVALAKGQSAKWTLMLDTPNPKEPGTGAPLSVGVFDNRAFVLFKKAGRSLIAALEVASGKQLWEAPAPPDFVFGMSASNRALYVVHNSKVSALSLAGGKLLYTLGQPGAGASPAVGGPLTLPPAPEPGDGAVLGAPAAPGDAGQGTPHLVLGTPVVSGRLPREVVARIVRQNVGSVGKCYEKALAGNPKFEGRAQVLFRIDRDGRVADAPTVQGDLTDPSTKKCLIDAFRKLTFPQPEGGIVTVILPLTYQQQ